MSDAGLQAVYDALVECDPVEKCRKLGGVEIGEGIARVPRAQPVEAIPGRPPRPLLCHPREMPKRSLGGPAGRAALLHAGAQGDEQSRTLHHPVLRDLPTRRAEFSPQLYYCGGPSLIFAADRLAAIRDGAA